MREQILNMLLARQNAYLSGEQISGDLGVTRAAVWKHIRALQVDGFEIEAAPRKGYRLKAGRDILCTALLDPLLDTRRLGRPSLFLRTTLSTNIEAKRLAQQGAAHGAVVAGEEQTAGRGRLGRGWVNARGLDICLSILARPNIETRYAARFTIATALGVYRLTRQYGLNAGIKWPNDVLVSGKKICGILLELEGTLDRLSAVVIGLGLNVNNPAFAPPLDQTATSFALEMGRVTPRIEVLANLLNILEPLYEDCATEAGFAGILRAYRENCQTIGREISITGIHDSVCGIARDVGDMGKLLLQTPDGRMHTFATGDVSLR
ncbi:MAG: biotin--[acetyl-CoA-carboxylase] ligase [Clostridiales bacterium]|jgi:BirA family biotin operon repressor/biotin-[acetyl-CoA-carboxylase] ligase|nr:biotin--[acetyl-CoA-carboxylase] ligase [Clostridiales bacterium]